MLFTPPRNKFKQSDLIFLILKPDIGKHPLRCSRHLYDARLINYRAI